MDSSKQKDYILVLGGSSFMGKDLLHKLSQIPSVEVHYINRGKTYWNNEVKNFPNLQYTYGDRDETEDFTKILKDLNTKVGISKESGKHWKCVVDFCAYDQNHIQSVYHALCNLIDLYIFISTDSVYDVCDREIRRMSRIVEGFAVRPQDKSLQKEYKKNESYGHKKLKGEETLYNLSDKQAFPFINFRLPDVLGPYDDSGRFWAYVEWVANSEEFPVELSEEDVKKKMSFVYSHDVTDLIIQVSGIRSNSPIDSRILFASYNLACHEIITLPKLLDQIALTLKVKLQTRMTEDPKTFFPSVTCGPLDCSRAVSFLDWKPTLLNKVLAETTEFFMGETKKNYIDEFEQAIESLPKRLRKRITQRKEDKN